MLSILPKSSRANSSRSKLAVGLLVLTVLLIPTVFMPRLPAAPPESKDKPNETASQGEQSAADEATAAAKETYEIFFELYGRGQALTENVLTWSQRWAAAEMESAKSLDESVTAAKAHLKRIEDLNKYVEVTYNAGRATKAEVTECRYFIAQAKLQVQKAEHAAKK